MVTVTEVAMVTITPTTKINNKANDTLIRSLVLVMSSSIGIDNISMSVFLDHLPETLR
jgi:hypothetical protein